jgi:hypothetical protein
MDMPITTGKAGGFNLSLPVFELRCDTSVTVIWSVYKLDSRDWAGPAGKVMGRGCVQDCFCGLWCNQHDLISVLWEERGTSAPPTKALMRYRLSADIQTQAIFGGATCCTWMCLLGIWYPSILMATEKWMFQTSPLGKHPNRYDILEGLL